MFDILAYNLQRRFTVATFLFSEAINTFQSSFILPEFELVTETENYVALNYAKEKSEEAKMKEYEEYLKGNKDLSTSNLPESDLNNMAGKESENDRQLRKFKERIIIEPEQVT